MTLASEVEAIGGLLKKYYESGPAKKQFFDDNLLSKRLYKNTRDILGGTATVGLHVGRNPGVGAAANGAAYGNPGKQTFNQTTIPLKYTYMPFQISGPDIENSKGNAAAFANVLTANADGAIADGKRDVNRQLFSDGSGALCCATADQDGSFIITTEPYLWNTADKYLLAGQRLDEIDYVDATTQLTTDSLAGAIIVAAVAAASVTGTSAEIGTGKDGDLIGKYGALQRGVSSVMVQNEMMGLYGAIHNSDMIGSNSYYYDAGDDGNTATTAGYFVGPEGQNHDWTTGCTNYFQGLATASYSWWKSIVYGNGGTARALSFSLLDKMIAKLRTERGAKTSAIYTTWQVNQKIVDLIRADRRYPDTMELDGGLKVSSYAGIPIIVDNDCPRGTAFFVDESEFALYEKAGFSFITDSKGNNMHKISGYDGFEVVGKVYANLGCMSRFKQGKIIDLLES